MKILLRVSAAVALVIVAYASLRLATSGRYEPPNAAVYALLWAIPLAALALLVLLRKAKP